MWTLEYLGVEQSAAAWGLTAEPVLRLRTQAAAQFSFKMAGADPAGAIPFPFEGQVIIRQNRTGAGTSWANDGSANHFVFAARLITPAGAVSGSSQDITLVFQDAWYDLENIPFQMQWAVNGGGLAYFSRAYLFYLPPAGGAPAPGYQTVAQQVAAIIAFAAAAGANIQAGEITGPSQMPWYPVRGLSCAAAIKKCLECFPDLITWIDGSTTPPSFHCAPRATLAAVSLPYKGTDAAGRAHKSSSLRPRYDLQPAQVVLQYQQTVASGGTSATQLTVDAWPALSTGRALRALVCPLDLRGSSASFASTQIVTQAFDPTDVVNFWQKHVKSLADKDIVGTPTLVDATINSGSAYGIAVKDAATGAVVNYAGLYPVELVRPSKVAAWTGITVVEAVVTGYLNYSRAKAIGAGAARPTDKVTSHLHTVKIKLCNAPPGTTPYQTQTAYNSGEQPVPGLAQAIYNSLAQLQFDGYHEIVEPNGVSQIIGPWNVLNLTGGAAAWAAMAASIPEVEIDFFKNTTRITIGPPKHLSPQDLNNYLQFFRVRVMWDNAQTSGGSSTGAAIDQSGDTPADDSNSAQPQHALKEVRDTDAVDNTSVGAVTIDPANQQITTGQFNPGTGASYGSGLIAPCYFGAGAPGAGNLPANVNFRVNWRYVDTAANAEYYCTTAGTNATSAWTAMGGGGGSSSAQQFIIIGDAGDYWNCLSFNNQVYGTVTQPVIKPMKLRAGPNAISSETIRGTAYDYTYTGASTVSVTVNGVTYTGQTPYYSRAVTLNGPETDYMIPDAVLGVSTIFAIPAQVSLNSVPISLLAATLASAGTGYTANQVLTLSGGTLYGGTGPAATIKVLTVSGTGAILTCALLTPGSYTTAPGLAGCGVTSGAATFNLTLAPNLIDLNVDGRAWAH